MIRKAGVKDISAIMKIWLEGNIDAHSFIAKEYWISNLDFVRKAMLQSMIFVYEEAGVIIGFAGMVENYIAGIFVDKKFRSKGIGKELLVYIKRIYDTIDLKVYMENHRAIDFYLRENFVIISDGKDEETGHFEYVMRWENK